MPTVPHTIWTSLTMTYKETEKSSETFFRVYVPIILPIYIVFIEDRNKIENTFVRHCNSGEPLLQKARIDALTICCWCCFFFLRSIVFDGRDVNSDGSNFSQAKFICSICLFFRSKHTFFGHIHMPENRTNRVCLRVPFGALSRMTNTNQVICLLKLLGENGTERRLYVLGFHRMWHAIDICNFCNWFLIKRFRLVISDRQFRFGFSAARQKENEKENW